MSVQRYNAFTSGGKPGLWESKDGDWVLFTDHERAVAEAVFQRGVDDANLYADAIKAAVAAEREACAQAVRAITDIAPIQNYGFDGDPKPYPLEGHCYECHGEQYGADAALDAAISAIHARGQA